MTEKHRVQYRYQELEPEVGAAACTFVTPYWEERHRPESHREREHWSNVVYEIYDKNDLTPLYIGRSKNLTRRVVEHREQPWWPQQGQGFFLISRLPCAAHSVIYEESRIREVRPLHNKRMAGAISRVQWWLDHPKIRAQVSP